MSPISLQNPVQNLETDWWKEGASFLWVDLKLMLLSGFLTGQLLASKIGTLYIKWDWKQLV